MLVEPWVNSSQLSQVFPLDWPRGEELCSGNRAEHVARHNARGVREIFPAKLGGLNSKIGIWLAKLANMEI